MTPTTETFALLRTLPRPPLAPLKARYKQRVLDLVRDEVGGDARVAETASFYEPLMRLYRSGALVLDVEEPAQSKAEELASSHRMREHLRVARSALPDAMYARGCDRAVRGDALAARAPMANPFYGEYLATMGLDDDER